MTSFPDRDFFLVFEPLARFLRLEPVFFFAEGGGFGKSSCKGVCPRLYMFVPQTGQIPRVAGVPLDAHSATGSCIIRFSLHLRQ